MKVGMVSDGWVKDADTLDGFHASQTPAPNVIVPLNANGRIYDYVAKGSQIFDPPDFTMSNNTEYFIGSVSITTPSWSPSGAWKVIFVVNSGFYNSTVGGNSFRNIIKINTAVYTGGLWYWYASTTNNGIVVRDTFLINDIGNNMTQNFNFYVFQGNSNGTAVFQIMVVVWYLIPA